MMRSKSTKRASPAGGRPEPGSIPSGDRAMYSSNEGQS